ncbi:low temperature requirement protein A [Streptomyces atratus]|uniref:low temperature requirement protein A n=1 Tax=Streptomyces atratus TaxID=1893 RepID=UPI0033C0BE4B
MAQASGSLHEALTEGEYATGVLRFALVFFTIWWAWMNFTWFASAYDPDDVPYRLTVLVQITRSLVLAAGVPRAFEEGDLRVIIVGDVVLRHGAGRPAAAGRMVRPRSAGDHPALRRWGDDMSDMVGRAARPPGIGAAAGHCGDDHRRGLRPGVGRSPPG